MSVKQAEELNVFKHVIENTLYLEKTITTRTRMKVFIYYLFGIFFFPHRNSDSLSSQYHIINGRAEFRTRDFMGIQELYYGQTFNNWYEIKKQCSHISYLSRVKRLRILISSLISYSKVKTLGSCYAYWLDFCMWNMFLSKAKPSMIISNGHYDRLTTILSELCREYSIDFQMKQHGLLPVGIEVPHRIHCRKVYAYDNIQIEIFKKYIVENNDCLYEIWYKPGFEFIKREFDRFTIGIIENKNVEGKVTEIYDIIKCIKQYGKEDQNVVIMLHPLSEQSEYEELVKNCRCNVTFTREKYFNYNVIISTPSTLAYDYVRSGYTRPIIFAEFYPRVKDCLVNYKNVIHVSSNDELNNKIAEMLNV